MAEKKKIELNPDQLEAINTTSGNLLILASAGTGKTTTIVERYVNLVENLAYDPHSILMTTFTNKAAKDMIRKINERTKKVSNWIGTMHSLFLKILREHASKIMKDENFTILVDDYDKKKIIKEILHLESIEDKKDNLVYLMNRISRFKNYGISADNLNAEMNFDETNEVFEELIDDELVFVSSKIKNKSTKVYKLYQSYLKENNIIDLDDILLLTYELFNKNEDIKNFYKNKFKIMMVDEAQDLNIVQIKILNLLEHDNLCLIGDDCQNIYSWRGSSNELVFRFDENNKKIILKENHRSTGKIINAVNKTIDSLKFKINKKLVATREKGSNIIFEAFESFDEEINYILSEIKDLINEGVAKEDIAVLFRTNNIGKDIEKVFRRNKIPCHLSKSRSFFEREEVKDMLSFLKLKLNNYSIVDFERVVSLIPGIGKVKLEKIRAVAEKYNSSPVRALDFLDELDFSDESLVEIQILKKILLNQELPIDSFLMEFGYDDKIAKKYLNDPEKIADKSENIETLKELYYGNDGDRNGIRNFLDGLIELEKKEKEKDKVVLSTIHSAKGLEWKYVFLAACNERILPYYRDKLGAVKRDDELRLFYVAISRSKDFLFVTHSMNNNWRELAPSQFLDIINGYT
jgi:DNA helicase-2/ATP-dependent DNA helicase PcrA